MLCEHVSSSTSELSLAEEFQYYIETNFKSSGSNLMTGDLSEDDLEKEFANATE